MILCEKKSGVTKGDPVCRIYIYVYILQNEIIETTMHNAHLMYIDIYLHYNVHIDIIDLNRFEKNALCSIYILISDTVATFYYLPGSTLNQKTPKH